MLGLGPSLPVIRVCETCLAAGNIDDRLAEHACELEAEAAALRKLIGRLRVPTYAQWQAQGDRLEQSLDPDNSSAPWQGDSDLPF